MVKAIKLTGASDVKKLNAIATNNVADVGIHSGNIIVDAKSLLGLMSLDFTKPILCVTEDQSFFKRIKSFLV